MFNKYYQDELAFLRELGQEFAQARPEAARFLGEAGSDPDVERLLEGFAFLTGRVRQKLDDELPELTSAMMELFFPQFLRPIPSLAILQVTLREGVDAPDPTLGRGTYVDSIELDGQRCRFKTTADVTPVAAKVSNVEFSDAVPPTLRLRLEALPSHKLVELEGGALRLYLGGDRLLARALYLCLCHRLSRVAVGGVDCPQARIVPACLGHDEGLLPIPTASFPGFRLLQEYFAFPSRYMFVDVTGLSFGGAGASCEIEFEFSSAPEEMPPVTSQSVQLNCVPIVNLFDQDADPVRVRPERSEYKIRPGGGAAGQHEVYNVRKVAGRVKGSGEIRVFEPLYSFHRTESSGGHYYEVRPVESLAGEGLDHILSLGGGDIDSLADVEVLSLELVCSNRRQADRLGLGDIGEPTSTTPLAFTYRNVSRPTATISAPVGEDVHWRLLANLSLNYLSLLDVANLRSLLRLYDFLAREDRQARRMLDNRMDAILGIDSQRGTLMQEGAPLRGLTVSLRIDEDKFGGEGEVFLFGTVFNEFLSQFVTLNWYSQLRIEIVNRSDVFTWPPRLGSETLA